MSGIISTSPDMRSGVVGKAPKGSIIQVIKNYSETETAVASGSWTAVNGTVTITPRFASSLIRIMFDTGGIAVGTSAAALQLQIKRNTTIISHRERHGYCRTGTYISCPVTYEYIDEPGLTTAIVYSLEATKDADTWEINSADGTNSLTAIAMEISN